MIVLSKAAEVNPIQINNHIKIDKKKPKRGESIKNTKRIDGLKKKFLSNNLTLSKTVCKIL